MRWRAVCASILIAAAVATRASGQEALDAIDSCLKRLDPAIDVGYERISTRCPELTHRLETSSWARWLPRDWQTSGSDLSANGLMELRALVARELATRISPRTPRVARLNPILAELGPIESHDAGPWTRFTSWLREALERGDPSPAQGWFDRMLERIGPSQALINLICYVALAVVVAMALALVVNELRVAGLFVARRGRPSAGAAASSATNAIADWAVIQSAPARERPRLLLELIAARLMVLNRLPAAGGFTVRELLQRARFAKDEDRSLLTEVALAAERVRFSGEPIPVASLERAVERGRQLLEHLDS